MRKILFSILSLMCIAHYAWAQPATFSNPLGIGRNNCSASGGLDSLYYFNYTSPNMTNSLTPITGCRPVLRTNFAPLSGYSAANKPFVIFNASIAFNPADQMIYYVWTDYNVAPPYKSYIWRWSPTTCPMPPAPGLDTFRTFNTDIGGITFDANGTAWQLEFIGPAPYKGMLRQVNFTTGTVGIPDTLDYTGGKQLWNVGTGDITLTPSGQMYFIFNNKLFTPDYGSAGGPTKHIKCTYIDTVRLPSGKTGLPGLAFGSGDLIASYSPGTGCVFKRIDPVTGDTAGITYTYPVSKGAWATDMTQINSGVGASKRLISVTATGTPGQYDVIYDVYVRNYGTVGLTNVQLTDNLAAIRGAAFLSNVSASLTSNPAGVTLNPLFNGNGNINLLAAGQTLPCYPVANNNFTVRISCRLSSLVSGTIYNNSAIITGNGFKNVALRDSSTNGANPDLNQNDKPDDVGEGQPTPLLIILTPITPPCAVLDTVLYNQNFGNGIGLVNNIPPSAAVPSASNTYIGTATAPLPINRFTVTNNASLGDASNWVSLADHTGGANGRMLVLNADASANIMYRDTLPVSCPGQQYSVSFWAAFIGNGAYQTVCDGLGGFKYPRILCRIRDLTTGLVITQYTSDTIKLTTWLQHGMRWVMPAGYTQVILELVNAAPGGCGNDLALDDIQYGICDPVPTVSINNPAGSCLGTSVTFTADISDASVIPGPKDYQWQWSPSPGSGPWTSIVGATASTYIINPITAADTGRYYRVIVAAQGNIGVVTCQYLSPGARLIGVAPSVAPTSISAPSITICNPGSATLTAVGATLGTGANYQWGTGAVVGTSPIAGATTSTLIVSPITTTTYWVRVENTTSPCSATTGGVTVVVTVNQPSTAPTSITGADFCNPGSTTLTAVGATLGTGATYQWGTGPVIGSSVIAGATSSTLVVSPVVTTTYWVRVQSTAAPCTAITSGVTKVVTVNQPSVAPASIFAPVTTFCGSASTSITAVGATLGTGANYQWGTGAVVGVSPIAGATSATLAISISTTTTYWVRVENTTSPCSATTGGITVTITINQPSTAPSSITGADFCNPGSTTLTALGGALGTGANYQWGTGAVVGVSPIAGATSSTLVVSPAVTTTYWVRIQNTTAPCTANTGGVTRVVTVTQPSVAPSSISAPSTTICNPGSATLTAVGATLGTGANYQWGTGAVVGTSPIAGATGSSLIVSPTTTTTYWVRVENTSSPCSATTGGVTVVVTVNQPSTAPASITGLDICNGNSTTLTANGGALGTGANYQWGTGAVVGSSPIAGATSSTLVVSPAVTTTYWVRIQNTATPCTANTGGVTKLVTVTQPSVAPSSISAPSTTICNPGSATLTAVGATLGTGANYQWGTGAVVGTSPIAGATSSSLIVSPTTTTTYWVRVENTSSPCSATTGGVTVVVTVNQPSTAPTSITGADYCNPGSTTLTAFGGALGTGANYQWGTGAVVGSSPIAGATSSTLVVSPAVTTTYWVRIQNTTAPCSANTIGVTKLVTVSQPSVAAGSATANKNNICPGISVNLGITGGTLGTNASWRWYTNACGTTLAGTGATLSVTPAVTTTYYVRAEGDCNTTTCQAITVNINCDIDKDNDGIPDFVESNLSLAFGDANSNGIINAYDPLTGGYIDTNNDFVNDNYQADGDINSNGIMNYLDPAFPGRVDTNLDGIDDRFDKDLDGIINMLDLDSDNDGIPDAVEAYGVDVNGDGRIDNYVDVDGDGLSDNVDANLSAPLSGASNTGLGLGLQNFDGDNLPNFLDLDSDNDGIPDVVEVGGPYTTNNGLINGFVDVNGDGLHDSYINGTALLQTGADITADGRADSWPNKNLDRDLRPNYLDLDADGDGIADVIEAGLPDANFNGLADGTIGTHGWSQTVDAMPTLINRNTDTNGNPDYLDIDSDDDGIPDNIEGMSTSGYLLPALTDTDGDGIVNMYDNVPAAYGGSGIFVYDHDGDGTPDYRDLDTDADGQPDIVEGNDFNLNDIADDLVTLTGLDTDNDGLDNRFDSLNSVINVKGTSYMMGNAGSIIGDGTPGSRCTVQKKTFGQVDRDWRFVGNILPVQFLDLTGVLQSDRVTLNWTVIASKEVDHFEIERSTDNGIFIKTGIVSQLVKLNESQNFVFVDDVSSVNKEVIFYRIKVIGKNGEIQYSNIVVIRRHQSKTDLSVMPNPAQDHVSIIFFAEKESDVTLRLIDNLGKTIVLENRKVVKGNNTLQLKGLSKYSNGFYMLQLFVNNEIVTQKIVLAK